MRNAIRACLCEVTGDEKSAQAGFSFPPSFVGFKGHFPDQPVLPGVCLILSALIAAEAMRGAPVYLESMSSAKFFSVVRPDQPILLIFSIQGGTLKTSISSGEEKVAQLNMRVIGA
jgi:3-hydroxymyristoyl/3-hydroxydecanoyl-(acyl carrier protein) dehydratase